MLMIAGALVALAGWVLYTSHILSIDTNHLILFVLSSLAVLPFLAISVQYRNSFGTTLDASALVLRDPKGEPRAIFRIGEDGLPILTMHDTRGKKRLQMSVDDAGQPGMMLCDPQGNPQLQIASLENEPSSIMFFDKYGHRRLSLGHGQQGAFGLFMLDDTETPRAGFAISAANGTPYLNLAGTEESTGLAMGVHNDVGPTFTMSAANEAAVQIRIDDDQPEVSLQRGEHGSWMALGIDKKGDSQILLSDASGTPRVRVAVIGGQPSVEDV